eukprot:TRINITY_DN13848_c0_g2_i2.p1 TRINITY_DN13848_c0_g2~~TRINITY_DN13848_c0_g2_i2.p1  ORF type:complete len:180 (-),score=30.76 TRINITY_DN13848_c0_g2_i2:83-622(-)
MCIRDSHASNFSKDLQKSNPNLQIQTIKLGSSADDILKQCEPYDISIILKKQTLPEKFKEKAVSEAAASINNSIADFINVQAILSKLESRKTNSALLNIWRIQNSERLDTHFLKFWAKDLSKRKIDLLNHVPRGQSVVTLEEEARSTLKLLGHEPLTFPYWKKSLESWFKSLKNIISLR